jgi:hypothetical protein
MIKAFCLLLLCSISWAGVAYAFPSELEIAFVKVSDSGKTAGCLVVWKASVPSIKNIYCRYELGKEADFLRDDDNGIVLSDIGLYPSGNNIVFQSNIKNGFKNKYPYKDSLSQNELATLARIMSNPSASQVNFGGKERVIHQFDNLYEDLPEEDYSYPTHGLFIFAGAGLHPAP